MTKPKAVMHWSGGKDSSMALYKTLQNRSYEIVYLVTNFNSQHQRVSMHGVRISLIRIQSENIGIPLYEITLPEIPDMETYNGEMAKHYAAWRQEGITHVIYGDIFLEDLRKYREKQLATAGLKAVFPLWKSNTRQLLAEFWKCGFQTMIICANQDLADFTGKILDEELIKKLPENVDPCGENGEFHTFVFAGPLFQKPIVTHTGETVYRTFPSPVSAGETGYFYTDIFPAGDQKL